MRRIGFILTLAILSGIYAAPRTQISTSGEYGAAQFARARENLTGPHKDMEAARKILLGLIDGPMPVLGPESLCTAYVYLGYIADRTGARQEAIDWFTRAASVPGAGTGILDVARLGLEKPVTWIRHLDDPESQPRPSQPESTNLVTVRGKVSNAGGGYVTKIQPPPELVPENDLSAEQRQANFEFLWEAIDRTYACFTLKSIDWQRIHARYRERLNSTATAGEFYSLMFQLVNELKDTHSWLQNYHSVAPQYGPGLSVDLFDGKPYVVAVSPSSGTAKSGARIGSEILAVDGMTVEAKLEQLRPVTKACSSERAYRREASSQLLSGTAGSVVTVKLLPPDGGAETLTLKRDSRQYPYHQSSRMADLNLTRQRFVHFGRLPSGLGYIRIESFNGHDEIADEFDVALQFLKEAPGLIIDVRDNTGGFGQPRIVGRFVTTRTLAAVAYQKTGPGHDDLAGTRTYIEPAGNWQYKRPVALLVNDVTGSAADLFTCYMKSLKVVTTIGSTTHGNLSGVAAYAVLPCGLAVRISNGFICDAKGRPVEGNGNDPDIVVSPGIGDFLAHRDPVLDRAVEFLLSARNVSKITQVIGEQTPFGIRRPGAEAKGSAHR